MRLTREVYLFLDGLPRLFVHISSSRFVSLLNRLTANCADVCKSWQVLHHFEKNGARYILQIPRAINPQPRVWTKEPVARSLRGILSNPGLSQDLITLSFMTIRPKENAYSSGLSMFSYLAIEMLLVPPR
jgi:hypothetical protein